MFYLLTTIPMIVLITLPEAAPFLSNYGYFVASMAFLTGMSAVLISTHGNVWTYFVVGFAQPLFLSVALLITGFTDLSVLKQIITEISFDSIRMGSAGAFGALVAAVIVKRWTTTPDFFSLAPFFSWLTTGETRMEKLQRFALGLAALVSACATLITNIQSCSHP